MMLKCVYTSLNLKQRRNQMGGITGITTYKELVKLYNKDFDGIEMTEEELEELEELMDKYIPRKAD